MTSETQADYEDANHTAGHAGLCCAICGRPPTWYNDVPLRAFCWGPADAEHEEWSIIVPTPYNPYLEPFNPGAPDQRAFAGCQDPRRP